MVISSLVNLFPFAPSGNFFNNNLSMFNFLCIAIFFSYLKNITGDKGAKVLIAKNKKYIKKVNILDNSILKDVDNRKMYEELLKYE